MKHTSHAKVPCPECKREIDVRGIRQHRMTHQPNIERITSEVKKAPVSVDLESFRIGFRIGREVGQDRVA